MSTPDLTYRIIGAAQEVQRQLGMGLSEAIYHEALCLELQDAGIPFESEKELTITYKGRQLEKTYRADIVCADSIILELKTVDSLLPEHESQLLNYLRITGMPLGLLINFGQVPLQVLRRVN